jgi:hypothetical protein
MTTMSLSFTGLCAFDIDRQQNEAAVILISQSAQLDGMSDGGAMPSMEEGALHVPCLVAGAEVFDQQATTLQITYFLSEVSGSSVWMGLVLLERQELTLLGAARGSLQLVDKPDDAPLPTCPDGSNQDWLSWIAPLHEIDPERGLYDDNCRRGAGDAQLPSAVGARFLLTEGKLYANPLGSYYGNTVYRWGFSTMDYQLRSPCQQPIAEVVTLDVDLGGATGATFLLTDLASGVAMDKIVVKQVGPGNLAVKVANLPLLDVMGKRTGTPISLGQHRPEDAHFDHFYRFASNAPAPGQGYVPMAMAVCSGPQTPDHPWCPPVRLS